MSILTFLSCYVNFSDMNFNPKPLIAEKEERPMNNNFTEFRLPHWNDLPPMPLYLDQVLSLIDEWLAPHLARADKPVMTKTMVNNYVKQRFIPAPIRRKYDRRTVAYLFIIAVLKPVYSIEEIISFIRLALDTSEEEAAYDRFCDNIEAAVSFVFHRTGSPMVRDPRDPRRVYWSVCSAFACQLYSRKVYLEHAPSKNPDSDTKIQP